MGALLSEATAATTPESILVLVTNGSRREFVETLAALPNLQWLFTYDESVAPDQDIYRRDKPERDLTAIFYMVACNQRALEQLLGAFRILQATRSHAERPRRLEQGLQLFARHPASESGGSV